VAGSKPAQVGASHGMRPSAMVPLVPRAACGGREWGACCC
jgi:hypothetical protein